MYKGRLDFGFNNIPVKDYRTLTFNNLKQLDATVKQWLQNGYETVGGVYSFERFNGTEYAQTILLK